MRQGSASLVRQVTMCLVRVLTQEGGETEGWPGIKVSMSRDNVSQTRQDQTCCQRRIKDKRSGIFYDTKISDQLVPMTHKILHMRLHRSTYYTWQSKRRYLCTSGHQAMAVRTQLES